MANIRSTQAIAEKWARVTPGRQTDYAAGIAAPRRDWAEATAAAAERQRDATIEAAQEGRFLRGVQKVGSRKWARKTSEIGTTRYGPGVRGAQQDYQQGFEPFRQVIEATQLSPRYPAGDPRNYERVRELGTRLHVAKTSG